MKNGTIKLDVVEGEIQSVTVAAGLDLAFERLFSEAQRGLEDPEASIDVGVRVVLFGCLWLEAICNERLRQLIELRVDSSTLGSALWQAVERNPFINKYALIGAFGDETDFAEARVLANRLQRIFDLRNSLVHFKAKNTPVAGPLDAEEFTELFSTIPDPDLIQILRPEPLGPFVQTILEGKAYLDKIIGRYVEVKSRTVSQ